MSTESLKQIVSKMAVFLFLFTAIGTTIVALSYDLTKNQIADNQKQTLLKQLNALISTDLYDNDLLNDKIEITDKENLGTTMPVSFYRARKQNQPQAIVFMPVAPDGYGGSIQLLVGITIEGTLLGVRVVSHQETPGLGDLIEEKRSTWIYSFNGFSLEYPPLEKWNVKKDGGIFDQFTGATITPRAIVKAVKKSLVFFQNKRDILFQ
jgi:Na+-translocating ferredoxin:NAD+ oxidoreductase subunit G